MLCEQMFGSLCTPVLFFLGVTEELDKVFVSSLLCIAYILVVSLSTLQCMVENAD